MEKKIFGRKYVPVKSVVVLAYFYYNDEGKVFYTMKAVGRRVNCRRPVSADNMVLYDEKSAFYIYADEPLMMCNGKQRTLPKAVLKYAISDDKAAFDVALEKLAGVLHNSRPFTAIARVFR